MVENLVLIVPDADIAACREALNQAGFGPNEINVPMRGKVRVESPEQATHWGSHWWPGEQLDAVRTIVEGVSPTAVIVASSEVQAFELFDAQAGDYIYVPVDPRLIDGLAMGLGELATPGKGLPYAPTVQHPLAEQYPFLWPLLQLRSEDVVPISLAANAQPLIDVLQAFVDGQGLTAEERDGIVADVGVAAQTGATVRLADMIPDSWQPFIRTKAEAEALGYFGGDPDPAALQAWADAMMGMAERE